MPLAARPVISSAFSMTPLPEHDGGRTRDRLRSAATRAVDPLRDRESRLVQCRCDWPLGLVPGGLLLEEPERRMAGRTARQYLGGLAARHASLDRLGCAQATARHATDAGRRRLRGRARLHWRDFGDDQL